MKEKERKDIRFCFKIAKEANFSVEDELLVVRPHQESTNEKLIELRIQPDKVLSFWDKRRIHKEAKEELVTQLAIPSDWVQCISPWIYDRSSLEKTSL